jgi:hypothetical protein
MLGHRVDLRLSVADALVLHQYGPAELGAVFDPARVGDLFVLGHAIVLGQGDQFPSRRSEKVWDGHASEVAVNEELTRLFWWRHAGRPRLRLC